MSTHADAIPDEMILAAVDRAVRHHRARRGDAGTGMIYAHLAVSPRSGPARHVHGRLAVLETAGTVERHRRRGLTGWNLTTAGRRRLQQARRVGKIELPESPQHQAWRDARTLAGQEIERFRRELRDRLTNTLRLLAAEPSVSSDALFEMARHLHHECRRLASATYCLREWAEPNDAHADIDDDALGRRAGRRNIWYWADEHGPATTGGEQ